MCVYSCLWPFDGLAICPECTLLFPHNCFNNVSDPTKDEAGTEIKTTDGYILQV